MESDRGGINAADRQGDKQLDREGGQIGGKGNDGERIEKLSLQRVRDRDRGRGRLRQAE